MKYIQITDKITPYSTDANWQYYDLLAQFYLQNKKIKKFSFINHSPQNNGEQNLKIYQNDHYELFYVKPNEILELTENFIYPYNISTIGIKKNIKFNITIGYED